jgi:hypothetical protein
MAWSPDRSGRWLGPGCLVPLRVMRGRPRKWADIPLSVLGPSGRRDSLLYLAR